MRFGILATLLTILSWTTAAQVHDRVGRNRHSMRLLKRDWAAANSTALEARGHGFENAKFTYYDTGLSACGKTYTNEDFVSLPSFWPFMEN